MKAKLRMRGTDVFAAIGDPTRRKVLDMLSSQNLAAGEIAMRFEVSRPASSQHLRILRRAKLIAVQKRDREHIYRVNPEPLREVHDSFSEEGIRGLDTFRKADRH